jgi:copper transport protein
LIETTSMSSRRSLGRRTRGLRLVVAALAAVTLTVLDADHVAAHAQLLSVTPSDGAVVPTAPSEVTLLFNEGVSLTGGSARVLDPTGELVSTEPSVVDETVVIPLESGIGDGTYTVTFQVISADSHRIGGASVFHVGEPTPGGGVVVDPDAGESAGWGIRIGSTVFTAIAYAGALLAAGACVFLALIARRNFDEMRAQSLLVVRPAVLGAAALVAAVPWRVARVGGGLDALRDNSFLSETMRGPIGVSTVITATALAILAVIATRPMTGHRARLAMAVGAVALAGFAIEGHTRSAQPRWLMMSLDVTHLASGALWIGGIAGLVVTFRASLEPQQVGVIVRRFSAVAVATVLVVSAAGVGMSFIVVPSWNDLTTTGYGRALIVKVALVLIVLALGAYNRRRLVPVVGDESASAAEAGHRLRRIVTTELAILLLTIGVTAVLVARSPVASTAAAAEPPTAPSGFEVQLSGGAGSAYVDIAPARAGSNQIILELRTPDGRPLEPVEPPTVALTEPELDVGPLAPLVHPLSDGVYHVIADIPLPGTWEMTIRVRVSDFQSASATTPIEIGA